MKIVVLTKSGQSPTKEFSRRLIEENTQGAAGDIEMLSGAAYLDPKVLRAGIVKGGVDRVFAISLLPFPPTAYDLLVIEGAALRKYGSRLSQAAARGADSWQAAMEMTKKQ